MAIISLQNVSYAYDENVAALDEINLEIDSGDLVAIVGHNGCGKSTLAKLLNALLLPAKGRVFVAGMDTLDEKLTLKIRQNVGMVFQNPDNQIVTTIVQEDVGFGPENLGVDPAEIRKRVDEALLTVNMQSYAASAPHMLSGGQKQRVAIAGMLAMQPNVLVLDEATSMLDPKGRDEVLNAVIRLNHEQGMTVIMITQHMEEVLLANRVVVMAKGKIALDGAPRDVFELAPRLRELGLGVPAMVELRDKLLLEGIESVRGAITVEEMARALCPLFLKK